MTVVIGEREREREREEREERQKLPLQEGDREGRDSGCKQGGRSTCLSSGGGSRHGLSLKETE